MATTHGGVASAGGTTLLTISTFLLQLFDADLQRLLAERVATEFETRLCRAVRCARLRLALLRAAAELKGVPLASTVEIVSRAEADLPQLFALAKGALAGLPGWSDERILEALRRDVIFVDPEHG